jgi:hypothetical protein
MPPIDVIQTSRSTNDGYKSATGLHCFMFVLGAVFATDADEAERIATANFMRGDDAMLAMHELTQDYVNAMDGDNGNSVLP